MCIYLIFQDWSDVDEFVRVCAYVCVATVIVIVVFAI